MFKAHDAKTWQRKFLVGIPVRVCALNVLFINNIHGVVGVNAYAWLKHNVFCRSLNSFVRWKKRTRAEAPVQFYPRKWDELTEQEDMFFFLQIRTTQFMINI